MRRALNFKIIDLSHVVLQFETPSVGYAELQLAQSTLSMSYYYYITIIASVDSQCCHTKQIMRTLFPQDKF